MPLELGFEQRGTFIATTASSADQLTLCTAERPLTHRLWPTGYSTATSSRTVPSLRVMVMALPIDRFSGSW